MQGEHDIKNVFYGAHESVASLLDAASEVCDKGIRVYGAILCAADEFPVLIDRLGSSRACARGISTTDGSPSLIRIPWSQGDNTEKPLKMFFWVEDTTKVAYFLSCQDRESFERCLATTYHYLSSHTSRVFLRTKEIRRALTQLAHLREDMSIRVREFVARGLIDDPDSVKKVRTSREWTDEDYLVVFDQLREENKWLSSLRLEVRAEKVCGGRIWKDASFSCDTGLQSFVVSVVKSLTDAVNRSRDFFTNRSSSSSPTGKPRPVSIEYADDVFSEKAQVSRLLGVLDKLSQSALSVYHHNPYLHASLIDYADGSNFDIWVTRQDGILIMPKRKGTHRSMQRVCDRICDQFEEGDVRDFQPYE